MKVFQCFHKYDPYIPQFEKKYGIATSNLSYEEHRRLLLSDRFYATHILKPAIDFQPTAFFTLWNYPSLQLKWARENGWNETNLKKILFAQVEQFKPDVFYTGSPIKFDAREIMNIGGTRMIKIAWFATPEKNNIDFSVYNTRFTNLPSDIKEKSETGYRSDLFQPAYDPAMDKYADSIERPVDIFFYGQYVPGYFDIRNDLINKLVKLKQAKPWNIKIALQYSIQYKKPKPNNVLTRKFIRLFNMIDFPPQDVRTNSEPPFFGLDLYQEISRSKIVFNAAVDFSGNYKVNMRNFEALGCGAHMLSDDGIYPEGLVKGRDFSVYKNFDDFIEKATYYLAHPDESKKIAMQGHETVSTVYSKEIQWERFQEIVRSCQ